MNGIETSPVFVRTRNTPFLVAGPCSAESPAQLAAVAQALETQGIDILRAGVWKPRTRPGGFQGNGVESLKWLQDVRTATGVMVSTEVANASHVELALSHGIDVLWIGARTTVNPFLVQEIADALRGVSIPVMVKNPVNPDLRLWLGGVERLEAAGLTDIALVHRGFSFFNHKKYRNSPIWQIPIDMRTERPDLMLLCDISHIAGSRALLADVAQIAMDLAYDGLMVEVHPEPDQALSDAAQQITPASFRQLIDGLHIRNRQLDVQAVHPDIDRLRREIDRLDDRLLQVLAERMHLVRNIGDIKNEHDIAILQPERWRRILERAVQQGTGNALTAEFIEELFKAIHQESIHHQLDVMNPRPEKPPTS
ncbi:MAG: bifunctional 3-deoxy-7-phosphoheptulonate synthase/chorismate mutase type II [Saprospiraceae bacterium]|nr:bifunctional 3-deoxy-7-phosphoheptulonate synthase/chorismate mutase type II [Saprospiraceae bacterium]